MELHFPLERKIFVSVLFELNGKLRLSDLSLCKIVHARKTLQRGQKPLRSPSFCMHKIQNIFPYYVSDIDFVSLPNASESGNLVFKLVFNHPDESQSFKILFLAASAEDKASWASDISQVGCDSC